ncbi:MAG: tetrahydromethanopterin S-methyltransferase subunit A [Candidatus Thermoplasmatota archaeon]
MSEMYPWPGDYKTGDPSSPVAVVTLADKFDLDGDKVAIWGPMRTENLGIEKVVANVVSNPNIRFIVVCGNEIRGHQSGRSLIKLIDSGIDEKGKIIGSPGAVPYIENLSEEAVERFREQVEVIDLIDINSKEKVEEAIDDSIEKNPGRFGEPYTAIKIEKKERSKFHADFALHSSLRVSPWGDIASFESEVE